MSSHTENYTTLKTMDTHTESLYKNPTEIKILNKQTICTLATLWQFVDKVQREFQHKLQIENLHPNDTENLYVNNPEIYNIIPWEFVHKLYKINEQ